MWNKIERMRVSEWSLGLETPQNSAATSTLQVGQIKKQICLKNAKLLVNHCNTFFLTVSVSYIVLIEQIWQVFIFFVEDPFFVSVRSVEKLGRDLIVQAQRVKQRRSPVCR